MIFLGLSLLSSMLCTETVQNIKSLQNTSVHSPGDSLRYKKYGSFRKKLKVLVETEIFYFATHKVEGIGMSKNVIKLCNSFYPWKYHPLLKAEGLSP